MTVVTSYGITIVILFVWQIARNNGSSSSRVDRSFVKHLGLNWSRCFYYAAALLLLALNQTRSRNIRLMKLFQFV